MSTLDLSAPIEGIFPTFEILLSTLQDYAKVHGYAVSVTHSKRHRDGVIRTRYIQCVKSGKPRDRVIDRQKPFLSQRTECPFRCRTQQIEDEDGNIMWKMTVMNETHNHEAHNPIAHHQHRKFTADASKQVAAMTQAGVPPKAIASSLSIEFPDQLWTMQDIYNLRRQLKSELLGSRSPMEAMLHELDTNQFESHYHLDDNGHITLLFFAHPDSLLLLKQYPQVVLMDCTYKTNRFHMPLLDIVGCTGLNRTFFAAFIFLSGETEKDYTSALKMFL